MLQGFKDRILEILDDEALPAVIQARVDQLEAGYKANGTWDGSSLSAATYADNSMERVLDIRLPDGTHTVYWVKAYYMPGWGKKKINVKVTRYFHSSEDYWESQIASEPERRVVIGGVHYRLGKNGNTRDKHNGFGGRRFDIEFLDGRIVTTYDLWYQGQIPPKFRDQLPDNAKWINNGATP